ncbi:MAG: LytR/AlgR family response regulator transcription factor [Candidatus Fimenecus sp.]
MVLGGILIRVLICDDDKSYAEDVQKHIALFMNEKHIPVQYDIYNSGEALLTTTEVYDMAFLDVEINGINGIDIGKVLKKNNENIIIFVVTAYDKYLDDALDLNVLRFLQKPINSQRFYAGLEQAIQRIDNSTVEVLLKGNDNIVNVPIQDIMYVEIVDRKTKVVTKTQTYMSKHNIRFWQERLVASFFYQTHKSFIVNLKYVITFNRDTVQMQNGDIVPVAFRKQSQFQKYFVEYFSRK